MDGLCIGTGQTKEEGGEGAWGIDSIQQQDKQQIRSNRTNAICMGLIVWVWYEGIEGEGRHIYTSEERSGLPPSCDKSRGRASVVRAGETTAAGDRRMLGVL